MDPPIETASSSAGDDMEEIPSSLTSTGPNLLLGTMRRTLDIQPDEDVPSAEELPAGTLTRTATFTFNSRHDSTIDDALRGQARRLR